MESFINNISKIRVTVVKVLIIALLVDALIWAILVLVEG